ncbi:MAG: cadmium-translocating P-type ATPase [Spirochaetaceae bacterium]|nr:cadmium-translocating P-type ATPase [Spirochaetaceae bacterium]
MSCHCHDHEHKHEEHHHEHEHKHEHSHGHNGCCCGHSHCEEEHEGRFSEEQKSIIIRCAVSAVLLVACSIINNKINLARVFQIALFAVPYLIIGFDVLWGAIVNIAHGEFFDENFLMSVATIGAFALGEYPEAVFVMLFSQIGELFEDYAVDKSRESIAELMNIRPDTANLEKDGTVVSVSPEEVHPGDVIVVRVGEKVPLDGVLIEGETDLDTKALTGESIPRHAALNETVLSGCINLSGVIKIRVEKEFGESTVTKILNLVENAASKKTKAESFITKFAHWYTPVVVCLAVVVAVIPPLLHLGAWNESVRRALVFLIVSCPCALVISIPMGFFVGIGSASKRGILIKGSCYIESLSKLGTAVFDKTGTLTKGVFAVTDIDAVDSDKDALLRLAAFAESSSLHPVAVSVCTAWKQSSGQYEISEGSVQNIKEHAGFGVEALIDGKTVCCGNNAYMEKLGVNVGKQFEGGTLIHVAEDGVYKGTITISDEIKPQSKQTVQSLKDIGVKKIVMLTGDAESVAKKVAGSLEIDEYKAGLLPGDKLDVVDRLIAEKGAETKNNIVSFIGDGINDAPVLRRADVGISMGALGSDAAIEASDVVLMDDNPLKVAEAVKISRKTMSVVKQNIWFSLGVKVLVLALGVAGLTPLWAAVFADVGVLVLAVCNSMRAGRFAKAQS